MSSYKPAARSQQQQESPENTKYRAEARQLKEFFPDWSFDDLSTLLNEVGGDVQVAATKISDGVAEQWGSVSRKKDKKPSTPGHTAKDSVPGRGDSRGRGGRGGRGRGAGGASARGRGGHPRGSAVNGRSPRTESPRPSHVEAQSIPAEPNGTTSGDASAKPTPAESPVPSHNDLSTSGWTDSRSGHETAVSTATAGSSWNSATTAAAAAWGVDLGVNGSATPLHVDTPPNKQPSKLPATSKVSWAQIVRPQEKPTPPAPPAVASPSHIPPTSVPSTTAVPPPEPQPEPQSQNREEPTTAQAPTWDDEPISKPTPSSEGLWITPTEEADKVEPESQPTPQVKQEAELPKESPSAEPPVEQQPSVPKAESAPSTVITPSLSQPTATPSPKLVSRPAAISHRNSAKYRTVDQPVVMPSSFGSNVEKVGMQFGSLSLAGDNLFDINPSEPEVSPTAPEVPAPSSPKIQQPSKQEQPAPPPSTAPATTSHSAAIFQQQQALPQQTQVVPSQPPAIPQQVAPQSAPQLPQQTQVPTTHASATSSLHHLSHQPAQQHQAPQHQTTQHQPQPQHTLASSHQHQQTQHQQPQQSHNQYSQHGLPTHIDPVQTQTPNHQQQPSIPSHSSYFGRGEAATSPYFHTPTPPASQVQDNPYSSFGQLGVQGQHQQGSHLGGFASADYGYADNQRGFYDTYGQQTGFGNRNLLGHEDVKGLPGTQQQPPSSAGIPPSNTQPTQPHASLQGANQPQPAGAQAPQQGYPIPYPYYSYPQSQQFYGYGPNYGQFKYPTMFQAPPGPGSAPSPVGKQPGSGGVGVNVQPQTNPYSQGLYPQGGYDEYQPHPHHQQHQQHQHSHSLGLGQGGIAATEYGKQLYGSGGQGGMQGFIGLGGQGVGQGGGVQGSNGGPRGTGSPDTPYKPYAPKDVGVSVPSGRGAGQGQMQGQAQPQGQGQGQGPQGQGFYSGARFGGNNAGGVGGGVGGPQQSAHHPQSGPQGHIGYPQGSNDGGFYPYQRQQPQYWP